ncbi:TIGR02147 family protein [Bdellovibrio sp. HCB337]|uniref:TIGR02147 family protein n=1 Tax=Bdellovibrio sp. HCB337 TaxID=3394358 RepID=UPI0039A5DD86
MNKDTIFEAKDYRLLLKKLFVSLKSERKKMSLQKIADKIGISKSFLKMVMDQQRHISVENMRKVAEAFNMDSRQKTYFYFLVLENLMTDKAMKSFFANLLSMIRSLEHLPLPDLNDLVKNDFVFDSSLHMIIKSLHRFPSFKNEANWVQQQLSVKGVKIHEIEQVLAQFSQSSTVANEFVHGQALTGTEGFERYKIGLKLAAQATEDATTYKPLRFEMMSLSFDRDSEQKAFEAFNEFRNKLVELSKGTTSPNSVIFVSNNMFCVANESIVQEEIK